MATKDELVKIAEGLGIEDGAELSFGKLRSLITEKKKELKAAEHKASEEEKISKGLDNTMEYTFEDAIKDAGLTEGFVSTDYCIFVNELDAHNYKEESGNEYTKVTLEE